MANKIKVKLILELRAARMSRNTIAATRHMSKNSVSDVFHIPDSLGITIDTVKDMDEEIVYRIFYPDKHAIENMYRNTVITVITPRKFLWDTLNSARDTVIIRLQIK